MHDEDLLTRRLFEAMGLPALGEGFTAKDAVQLHLHAAPSFYHPVAMMLTDPGVAGGEEAWCALRAFETFPKAHEFHALADRKATLPQLDVYAERGRIRPDRLREFRDVFAQTAEEDFREVPLTGCDGMTVTLSIRVAEASLRFTRVWTPGLARRPALRRFIEAVLRAGRDAFSSQRAQKALEGVLFHMPLEDGA